MYYWRRPIAPTSLTQISLFYLFVLLSCMSHSNIALRLCVADGMNRLCNVHYEHSVPKAKSVKGLRLALVFRQGNTREIDQDSGIPVKGLSSLHLPGRFFGHPHHRKIGKICIVEGGGLYSRKDLLQSGAHCLDMRGVDGNKDCGVCAIVVSRQDKEKGEGDGLKLQFRQCELNLQQCHPWSTWTIWPTWPTWTTWPTAGRWNWLTWTTWEQGRMRRRLRQSMLDLA